MNDVIMAEGTSENFDYCMQSPYNYFDNCNDAISKCKVIEELNVDNGSNNILKTFINKQKDHLEDLSNIVKNFENEVFNLDKYCSIVIDEIKNKKANSRRSADEIVQDMLKEQTSEGRNNDTENISYTETSNVSDTPITSTTSNVSDTPNISNTSNVSDTPVTNDEKKYSRNTAEYFKMLRNLRDNGGEKNE